MECRAFRDEAGVVPISRAFNVETPGVLVHDLSGLVEVGGVLCYVRGDDEVDEGK